MHVSPNFGRGFGYPNLPCWQIARLPRPPVRARSPHGGPLQAYRGGAHGATRRPPERLQQAAPRASHTTHTAGRRCAGPHRCRASHVAASMAVRRGRGRRTRPPLLRTPLHCRGRHASHFPAPVCPSALASRPASRLRPCPALPCAAAPPLRAAPSCRPVRRPPSRLPFFLCPLVVEKAPLRAAAGLPAGALRG